MSALISIVVPVYNVEGYVRRCFESVTNQTWKDFEVIVIDDGSMDKSGKYVMSMHKKILVLRCFISPIRG